MFRYGRLFLPSKAFLKRSLVGAIWPAGAPGAAFSRTAHMARAPELPASGRSPAQELLAPSMGHIGREAALLACVDGAGLHGGLHDHTGPVPNGPAPLDHGVVLSGRVKNSRSALSKEYRHWHSGADLRLYHSPTAEPTPQQPASPRRVDPTQEAECVRTCHHFPAGGSA